MTSSIAAGFSPPHKAAPSGLAFFLGGSAFYNPIAPSGLAETWPNQLRRASACPSKINCGRLQPAEEKSIAAGFSLPKKSSIAAGFSLPKQNQLRQASACRRAQKNKGRRFCQRGKKILSLW